MWLCTLQPCLVIQTCVSAENLSIPREVTSVYLWKESGPLDSQAQINSPCVLAELRILLSKKKRKPGQESSRIYTTCLAPGKGHWCPAGVHRHISVLFVIPTALTVNMCSLQGTLYRTTGTCHFQQQIATMTWVPLTVPQNIRERGGTMTAITPTWMGCTGWVHMGAMLMASTGRQAKNTTTPISKRKWSSGQFNMVTGCPTRSKRRHSSTNRRHKTMLLGDKNGPERVLQVVPSA